MTYQRTEKAVVAPQKGDLVTSRWSGNGAIHMIVEVREAVTRYALTRSERRDTQVVIESVASGRGRLEWTSSLVQVVEV